MVLTNKQEQGLKLALEMYKNGDPWICIAGCAGSGKTTLIKFIIEALQLDPENDVAYVAFTGKAASVLRQKGNPNACTAHKLLYQTSRMPNGKYRFSPRKTLEKDYKVIVVDEISMLAVELWELLLSQQVFIIACGDPFQLPPINKNADNHVLDKPHIFLDEVMRQAQESEIIRLTMDIREGKRILYTKGNEVQVIPYKDVVDGMYHWADQILVATNKNRREINDFMRDAAGRGIDPEVGDKVICLINKWDILDSTGENALVNGTIGHITDIQQSEISYPLRRFPNPVPIYYCNIESEKDGLFQGIIADYRALREGVPTLSPQNAFKIYQNLNTRPLEPVEINYGYAITTHRAQGSEWGKVLVCEEQFPFDREEHARWLYTACTRASEKLVLVR
jgi:exodeoxyribonuclease-5